MDKIVTTIAALGIPGLILLTAMNATGFAGGAALTTALAALGPGGMIGGILSLGVIGLVSQEIAKYGFESIFMAVVKELEKHGETKDSILEKIDKSPCSSDLKRKLREKLESL